METDNPPQPDAKTSWNRWGWFGGTLGPIAFLPISAPVVFRDHPLSAALFVPLFLIPLVLSLRFWCRRSQLSPWRALTVMLAVGLCAIMAGMAILHHHAVNEPLSGKPISANAFFIVPLAYALALWQVHSQARRHHFVRS